MRKLTVLFSAVAFALSSFAVVEFAAAAPKKTTLGCTPGKEKWDATAGKCMPAKPVKKAKK